MSENLPLTGKKSDQNDRVFAAQIKQIAQIAWFSIN